MKLIKKSLIQLYDKTHYFKYDITILNDNDEKKYTHKTNILYMLGKNVGNDIMFLRKYI